MSKKHKQKRHKQRKLQKQNDVKNKKKNGSRWMRNCNDKWSTRSIVPPFWHRACIRRTNDGMATAEALLLLALLALPLLAAVDEERSKRLLPRLPDGRKAVARAHGLLLLWEPAR